LLAVLDYGIGNLHSAQKSLEHEGADARLTADPALIADADGGVLPGVGAFGAGMQELAKRNLIQPLKDAAVAGIPFLGICVGMQIMAESSEEGCLNGLGWIKGSVKKFDVTLFKQKPFLPHMGWNTISPKFNSPLFRNLDTEQGF